ncbi:winged helix-turn-helix domain-containing protein [Asticcacaulis sp. EMRT-3]|uniref:helix-turn-helix domain-containing protein n=1 Tax=Asticcacaulis sp. EMRT-3 TaxID=3040349 RepID=UPI0024AFE04C|nr:winged helix-turn-helix domain-containing protein [Asticcacaulis sp. EMRT-3]MDI7775187.1 winged helix-turn-helix domain-containing protein [Asticcacaulis sp. EMRT-3]
MLKLRNDFDAAGLRSLARHSRDANQARRLLALAVVYDGGSRSQAAKTLGCGVQILRDWVERFNDGGPDYLFDRKAKGAAPKLNDAQQQALIRMVEAGPIPAIHGVVRWRLIDLVGWIHDEYGISMAENTLGGVLKKLGYRKLSARPKHHAQNEYALEEFKKNSQPNWQRSNRSSQKELT